MNYLIGTIVNTLAILLGGGIGCMIRGKFPVRVQRLILQFIGIVALFLGARSFLAGWFADTATGQEATGTILVIFALLVGSTFGEALRLDRLVDKFGKWLSRFEAREQDRKDAVRHAKQAIKASAKAPATSEDTPADETVVHWWQISKLPTYDLPDIRTGNRFADGFAWATLLCAVSSLSFSGAITAGLTGEPKELFIKAAIDAVIILFLASIYGMGATFGALPVLCVQGIMVFISHRWKDLMTPTLIAHLTILSAVITLGAGICLCFGKKWRVINLLPALLISPIYGLIVDFGDKLIKK